MQSDSIIAPAFFGAFGFVVYTISSKIRRGHTARAVADPQSKLLDKCAVSQGLVAYMESAAGRSRSRS